MKKCVYVVLLLMLFACGNHPDSQTESVQGVAGMVGDTAFTPEIESYIQSLADLDCRIYLLVQQSVTGEATAGGRDTVLMLRQKKKEILEKILAVNTDSSFVAAVKQSIHKYQRVNQNCIKMESSDIAEEPDKDVAPGESGNIREDAGRLAELNCKIMNAHKRVEAKAGNPQEDAVLKALLRERQTMYRKLTGKYGIEVLHDGFFRKVVMEQQNEKCNYTGELKAAGRVNPLTIQ